MPLSGPSSFLPCLDEFLAHWAVADAALGAAGPIVLPDGTASGDLLALRNTLESRQAAVESARNGWEFARAVLAIARAEMLERLNGFNARLRGLTSRTRWLSSLPAAFSITEGRGRVLSPLEEMLSLWAAYEAAEGTLVLRDGYALSDATAGVAALAAAFSAHAASWNGLRRARGEREETQDVIRPVLKAYRLRIAGDFAADSAVRAALPRLTPTRRKLPRAVAAVATWDAAAGEMVVTWNKPTDRRVVRVEVRLCAGAEYEDGDASVAATRRRDEPPEWRGTFGPEVPGAVVSGRVFVLSRAGAERGSNTVRVIRPG